MNLQELVINGVRVISQKDYATATGVSESAIGQRKDLPFTEFENLRGKFIDLDKLALFDKETELKIAKITVPKANLYHYSQAEIGLLFANWIADSQQYKTDTQTMLDHLGKELETLKVVYEKSQKDLGNALDRENALRDEKGLLVKEIENLSGHNMELADFTQTLQSEVLEKNTQIVTLTADLANAHKDLAQVQTVLTDTKHDNDLKVLEVKALQSEKAGLEKENATLQAKLTEKESLVEQATAAYKQYFEKYQTAKEELAKAQKDEEIAVLKLEKELDRIEALEEKLEAAKSNQVQFQILAKILEGNSRFAEPFEVWFEKNPKNPNNMRPLVKTSLGYFLGTGVSLTPENELVSLADYPSILANTLKSSKGGAK